MFENVMIFFRKITRKELKQVASKDAAKERLHLVLMQDRANVSADFLELMKQEIIDVIKKYIEVDEAAMDVRLTNKVTDDGLAGAPALYANIPILNIKNEVKTEVKVDNKKIENTKVEENEEKPKQKKSEKEVEKEVEKDKKNIQEPNTDKVEKVVKKAEKKTTKS